MTTIAQIFSGVPMPAYAKPAGVVFVIRCIPDIYTGEQFNVGVCAVDGITGKRHVKVIATAGRLQCLYGDAAYKVINLAQVACEAAEKSQASPSPQIVFDEPTPFYNSTAEAVAVNTFNDQVTVALPQRELSGGALINDEQALAMVADEIKLMQNLPFGMIANTPQVIINTERGARAMHIPLQPENGVGTIKSAFFSAPTLKNHLMDSVLDLDCASRYRSKKYQGLFLLRPSGLHKARSEAIDNVIDSITFRAPANMVIEVSEDAHTLALACAEWGETAN